MMGVPDFGDGQITVRQSGMFEALKVFAEAQFIRSHAENHRCADIIPTARAAAQIYAAAVGNEPRLQFGVWCAEHDGIKTEVRIHVARRGQERFEELVAGAVRLAHGSLTPEVALGSHGLFEWGDV